MYIRGWNHNGYVNNITLYYCLLLFLPSHYVFMSEDHEPVGQCVFFPTLRYKIWEKEYFISVLGQSLRWLELTPQKKTAGRWQVEVFPHAIFLGGCNTVVHLQEQSITQFK